MLLTYPFPVASHAFATSTTRKPSGSASVIPCSAQYGFAGGIGSAAARATAA